MRSPRGPEAGVTLLWQLTFTVVLATLGPLAVGLWLDDQLRIFPIITVVMVGAGILLGVAGVSRRIDRVYRRVTGDDS